jgi:hypothetical protein
MKRASRRNEFFQPLGGPPPTVTAVRIDAETGLIAGERCEKIRYEYFIRGTEPKQLCKHEPAARSLGRVPTTISPSEFPPLKPELPKPRSRGLAVLGDDWLSVREELWTGLRSDP